MLFGIYQGLADGERDKLIAISPEAFADACEDAREEGEGHGVSAEDWFESKYHGNVTKIGDIEMTGSTDILHGYFPINED